MTADAPGSVFPVSQLAIVLALALITSANALWLCPENFLTSAILAPIFLLFFNLPHILLDRAVTSCYIQPAFDNPCNGDKKNMPPCPLQNDLLVDEKYAAQLLGVAVTTLQTWRFRKQGPSYTKVEGAIRYRMSILEQYVADRTYHPSDAGPLARLIGD